MNTSINQKEAGGCFPSSSCECSCSFSARQIPCCTYSLWYSKTQQLVIYENVYGHWGLVQMLCWALENEIRNNVYWFRSTITEGHLDEGENATTLIVFSCWDPSGNTSCRLRHTIRQQVHSDYPEISIFMIFMMIFKNCSHFTMISFREYVTIQNPLIGLSVWSVSYYQTPAKKLPNELIA